MSDLPREHRDQQTSDTPGVTPATNGVDYTPRMPDAVRRAAARAEELAAELAQEQQITADEEVQAAIVGGEAEPPRQFSPPPAEPPPPQDDWQNRYRTLQGKYDHEVPQLQAHIRQLENLISTMNSAPRTPEPQPMQTQQPPLISDDDITTYGEDFVESTRRWARAEVQQDLLAMQQRIDELQSHAQQSTGDRLKDRVRAALNRDPEIADVWERLDTDTGFNAWLGDFDPFSGHRRLDMLREAYASGDAVRTGRFFKAYLHEHTNGSRMLEAPAHTPAPVTRSQQGSGYYPNGAGQVDLAAYAAPGRASNATPGPGAPERRIWTNRDIQAFYEGRLKGRYRGREAEADRLERDILAAAQEGRVSQ